MKNILLLVMGTTALLSAMPAIPLLVKDPYLNVWQMADNLCDDWARHWTGGIKAIAGMIRIDGKPYKFMGLVGQYPQAEVLPQSSIEVYPTRTKIAFQNQSIGLELTFLTPALPNDYKLLSLPITYIVASVRSIDGASHSVQLYFDISAEWAGGDPSRKAMWSSERVKAKEGDVISFKIQAANQNILQEVNDYADWGFATWCTGEATNWEAGADSKVRTAFLEGKELANDMDWEQPRAINDRWPVFAFSFDLGKVTSNPQSRRLFIGYIREPATSFAGNVCLPVWKSYLNDWRELVRFVWDDFPSITSACEAFDKELLDRARKVGGDDYAFLISLVHRQVLASCDLVYTKEGRFLFMKEISSGSFIQTVDVIFPASPFFLVLNPELLEMLMEPVFLVSESKDWKEPFAPHDLGHYPLAERQSYGAPMPIEESGNMLLMTAAYIRYAGDLALARKHFDLLHNWADYLAEKGLEPEEQLSTDDFTGPSALNVNLAAKAIAGVAAFSNICDALGMKDLARQYRDRAEAMLAIWLKRADAKTHLGRIYDEPDTWSLKYNIFYAKLAGVDIFPKEIVEREIDFYLGKLNKYGVPLDERFSYTKGDWLAWVAFMSEDEEKREKIFQKLVAFAKETPDKVPFTDWYDTQTGKAVGFRARAVLGAIYGLLAE